MVVISEQNGGAERFYEFETDSDEDYSEDNETKNIVEVYQRRRSYVLAVIDKDQYNRLKEKIVWFRQGEGKTVRDGAIKLQVYHPGEELSFDRELLTTDDYSYPEKTVCYSTVFTTDVIEDNHIPLDTYRFFAVDMIWCRENTLKERLDLILINRN